MQWLQFGKPRRASLPFGKKLISKSIAKRQNPVTHVIFDLDGTLIDSESIYRQLFTNLVMKYGVKFDDETQMALAGKNSFDRCRYIVKKFGLSITSKQLFEQFNEMRKNQFDNCQLKPGAERLITHLHRSKVPMAVATGTNKLNYDVKTKTHSELFRLIHHVVNVSSDPEVPVGKPDPTVYLVAAKRFEKKPAPLECLVFEDSLVGVLAAIKAGMQVVLVPEEDYPVEQTKDATMTIKSLNDFIPEQFSLPPYPQ